MYVAGQEGIKDQVKEKFLNAYFENIVPLNDIDTLADIMGEFGWGKDRVVRIIADQSMAKIVKDEITHYQQRGVRGVPFFVINDKYGISGAQPVETFLAAFESVAPLNMEEGEESCDIESGIC